MSSLRRVRRRDELSVRLAWIVAVALVAAMIGTHLYYTEAQGWFLRRYTGDVAVDYEGRLAEARPGEVLRDDAGRRLVSEREWESVGRRADRIALLTFVLLGTLVSVAVGWTISRIVTRRVRALARAVEHPIGEGLDLPGPFPVGRPDELGVLAAALNDMRARIQALVAELAERDQSRRRWLALVSHDLRNPLQALTACIDRAADEARSIGAPAQRDAMQRLLDTARHDVDRFESLTQDLLDIARLDAEDALRLEPAPPGELARAAVGGLRVLAETHGRAMTVSVAPRCPELMADGRRVLRALENLLRNAIQHARTRVDVTVGPVATAHGPAVRFAVADDGPGLPEESPGVVDVARLGAYKSRDDSAGLGLVVARRVAEAHGGRIGAFNPRPTPDAPPSGGTVWFELPAGDVEDLPSEAELDALDTDDEAA